MGKQDRTSGIGCDQFGLGKIFLGWLTQDRARWKPDGTSGGQTGNNEICLADTRTKEVSQEQKTCQIGLDNTILGQIELNNDLCMVINDSFITMNGVSISVLGDRYVHSEMHMVTPSI